MADNFGVDDEVYADFTEYVAGSGMKYETSFDALLKEVRNQANEQGYMTAANDSTLKELETMLGSDLRRDLDFKKKEILDYLTEEIATRYLGDRGRVAVEIRTDPAVRDAIGILESPLYGDMLKGKGK